MQLFGTEQCIRHRVIGRLVGMISLEDLLKARARNLDAEQRHERTMDVRIALPFGLRRAP